MRSLNKNVALTGAEIEKLNNDAFYGELLAALLREAENNGEEDAVIKYAANLRSLSKISGRAFSYDKNKDGRPVFPRETPEEYAERNLRQDLALWGDMLNPQDFKSPIINGLAPADILRANVLNSYAAANSLLGKNTAKMDRKPPETTEPRFFKELKPEWAANEDIMVAYALYGNGISQKAIKHITAARIRHNIAILSKLCLNGKISPKHTPLTRLIADYGLFADTTREKVYISRFLKMVAELGSNLKKKDRNTAIKQITAELQRNIKTISPTTLKRLGIPQERFKSQRTAKKSEGRKIKRGSGNSAEENDILSFIHENGAYLHEFAYMRTIRAIIRHNNEHPTRKKPITAKEEAAYKQWCGLVAHYYNAAIYGA